MSQKEVKELIYTITFNPALDYIVKVDNFNVGKINRCNEEIILPGGKGINVSIVLSSLGIDTTALGFVAGFTGDKIESDVKNYGIIPDFVKLETGNSRINVKIATNAENRETAINCSGPIINKDDLECLSSKLNKIEEDDVLVLSGSIPKGISNNVYEEICGRLKKNIKVVVDATGDLLLNTLKYKPFLIKPNLEELGEIFNTEVTDKEQALQFAERLQEKGAKNVLVSMGRDGAVFIDENGYTYKMNALKNPDIKMINTVGAGDSMVAGFIAGYELFKNYDKAFRMGMAAGAATVNSEFLATKEEIYKLLK